MGGVIPNLVVFLPMMSPVEPGLPHARLSTQARRAAPFPMQLDLCCLSTASDTRITLAERLQTHKQQTVEPAAPATSSSFYARPT